MLTPEEARRIAENFLQVRGSLPDLAFVESRREDKKHPVLWLVVFKRNKAPMAGFVDHDEVWVEVDESSRQARLFPTL